MQRTWLDFATKGWESGEIRWSTGQDWPSYDAERRASRVILSARDLMVDDPDAERGLGGPAVRL
jgi:para-nitrobenzyl esterase